MDQFLSGELGKLIAQLPVVCLFIWYTMRMDKQNKDFLQQQQTFLAERQKEWQAVVAQHDATIDKFGDVVAQNTLVVGQNTTALQQLQNQLLQRQSRGA